MIEEKDRRLPRIAPLEQQGKQTADQGETEKLRNGEEGRMTNF